MLVIDGDLRHASASSYIDSPDKGLSDYLGGRIDNLDEIIVPDPKHKSMDILPVGTIPPNPTELLFDERLKQTIDTVREQYDYVLIDCPPVELVADTQIIEKLADRTVFVVRAGLLERSMLAELEKIYEEKKIQEHVPDLERDRGKWRSLWIPLWLSIWLSLRLRLRIPLRFRRKTGWG